MPTTPLSQRRSSGSGRGCLSFFFLLFLLAGAAASYFALWKPLSGLLASHSWTETRCDVLSSQVAEVSSSDGSTYRVDIRYSWTAGGSTHVGNRYDFMIGSSSGTAGKQRIVDRYPPGSRVACWVDPEDASEAVLSRGLSPAYLVGLVPLVFVAVGLGGMIWTARSVGGGAGPLRAGSTRAGSARVGAVPAGMVMAGMPPFGVSLPPAGRGPAVLKPSATPLGMLLGLSFVALFWNGIVSVFVWHMIAGWRAGQPDGCLTAFLVPFVLVGLGLIYVVGRQLLVLFNPRLHLTMTPGVLSPGESAIVQWRLGSGGRGVSRVLITLQGREEARYRRGTHTYTDRETFLTLPIVDTTQPYEIAEGGSASFTLPAGMVPSFRSAHNRIVWTLKAQCELPRWPDTEEEYETLVQPGGAF
jgi:hypothetical protein